MKNKLKLRLKKDFTILILFILSYSTILTFSYIGIIQNSKASYEDIIWSLTFNIECENNLKDNVVLGEAINASNGKDIYDMPKPPPPQIPYLKAWFTTDLEEPYNILWEDYRTLSEDNKTWNLTILWVSEKSSTTNITIAWEISEVLASGYDLVYLYTPDIVDMKINNNYQFISSNYEPHNFQIILQNKELNGTSSDTNNISSTLIIGFIIVIVIIIIAVYIKKRK